jgi:hypothetical protein
LASILHDSSFMFGDPRSVALLILAGCRPKWRFPWRVAKRATVAMVAMVALVHCLWPKPICTYPGDAYARGDVTMLEQAVETSLLRGHGCPETVDDLVRAGVLTRAKRDPWNSAYWFAKCFGADIQVCSLGPDRLPRTGDDICSDDDR